jgi:hypothetical protein
MDPELMEETASNYLFPSFECRVSLDELLLLSVSHWSALQDAREGAWVHGTLFLYADISSSFELKSA